MPNLITNSAVVFPTKSEGRVEGSCSADSGEKDFSTEPVLSALVLSEVEVVEGLGMTESAKFVLKSRRGFTLVEILITVLIVSSIAIVAIPGYRRFNNDQLLKNDVAALVQTLRTAQGNSQAKIKCSSGLGSVGWNVIINPNSPTPGYTLKTRCSDNSYDPLQTTTEFKNGIDVNSVSFNNPDSVCSASLPVTVTFTNQDKELSFFSNNCSPTTSKELRIILQGVNGTNTVVINKGGSINVL